MRIMRQSIDRVTPIEELVGEPAPDCAVGAEDGNCSSLGVHGQEMSLASVVVVDEGLVRDGNSLAGEDKPSPLSRSESAC